MAVILRHFLFLSSRETLPDGVMGKCMLLHDACLRDCITRNNGYECLNEGDSFIIAFASTVDAVR